MYTCMFVCVFCHACICMCVYIFTDLCIYTYMYIYIHMQNSSLDHRFTSPFRSDLAAALQKLHEELKKVGHAVGCMVTPYLASV